MMEARVRTVGRVNSGMGVGSGLCKGSGRNGDEEGGAYCRSGEGRGRTHYSFEPNSLGVRWEGVGGIAALEETG